MGRLFEAQRLAKDLFALVDERAIVRPGRSEREVGKAIYALAKEEFGIKSFWHKRIVRAGTNTLHPYRVNPPDRVIEEQDIAFIDLGPVFAEWEADFGRTYVFGDDPARLRIASDVDEVWAEGLAHFRAEPALTCAGLYRFMQERAEARGWSFGGEIAGHRIGEFPHDKICGDAIEQYIHPENERPLARPDEGVEEPPIWILEAHLIDCARGIGAFYEDLLR